MVVILDPELETALQQTAQRTGTTPETLALDALRQRFLVPRLSLPIPQDDWERDILSIGRPIGAALSNEAISSEGIYE